MKRTFRTVLLLVLLVIALPQVVLAHAIAGAEYYYHSSSAYHSETIPIAGHSYHIDDSYYLQQFTTKCGQLGLTITESKRCHGDGYGSTASDVTVASTAAGGGGGGGGGDVLDFTNN